jgi:hypothetical protein
VFVSGFCAAVVILFAPPALAGPDWIPVEGSFDGRPVSNYKSYMHSEVKDIGDGIVEAVELQDQKTAVTDADLKITYRSVLARHRIKCAAATMATATAEYFAGNMAKGDRIHVASRAANTVKYGGAIAGSTREFIIKRACAQMK